MPFFPLLQSAFKSRRWRRLLAAAPPPRRFSRAASFRRFLLLPDLLGDGVAALFAPPCFLNDEPPLPLRKSMTQMSPFSCPTVMRYVAT